MTGGSSGGGWVSRQTLLSVTSYGYAIEPNHLYGPYLSTTAKALYRGVSGKKKKRKGGKGGKAQASGRQGALNDSRRAERVGTARPSSAEGEDGWSPPARPALGGEGCALSVGADLAHDPLQAGL